MKYVINLLSKINIVEQELVQDHVLACWLIAHESRVYDLTVENEREFFSDGVLVSNCMDANCYLTRALFTSSKKPNKIITSETKDIIPARIASSYDLNRDRLLKKKRYDNHTL